VVGVVTVRAKLASLKELRGFLNAVDWRRLHLEISRELEARIVITGPVNSGKSTLFNLLKGAYVSPASPVAGTTRSPIEEHMGPFLLVDTPGLEGPDAEASATMAQSLASTADLVLFVVDGSLGVRSSQVAWFHRMRTVAAARPVLLVVNKVDLLKQNSDAVVRDFTSAYGTEAIGVSALRGTNVAQQLLPEIIDRHPDLAVVLGRELPPLRRRAANRVVMAASVLNAAIGVEPIPFVDIPALLLTHSRMVLRIAAIYGEEMTSLHVRELIATFVGGMTLRYIAREFAKAIPIAGNMLVGGLAAAGTWAMGQVAIQYFEEGKRLTPAELRQRYGREVKARLLRRDASPITLPPPRHDSPHDPV